MIPRPAAILLCLAWFGAGGSVPAFAAEADPVPADALARNLARWERLTGHIEELRTEAQRLELSSRPDEADRNWWNPFWRTAAEWRLQRANEIVLELRDLERQRRETGEAIARDGRRWLARIRDVENPAEAESRLWTRLDAWRARRWLGAPHPDPGRGQTLQQELTRRARDLAAQDDPAAADYRSWLERIEARLEGMKIE